MSAFETQVGGDHYTKLKIQPMEYSMANKLDACQHTVVKYVTRFRDKGGRRDLEKAMHVIQMLIDLEYPEAMEVGPTIAPMDTNITETYGLFPQLRKKQTFPIPDADGWIEWTGKTDRPLWDGRVEVKFRNGETYFGPAVSLWYWIHDGGLSDIIAWRPAKEQS